MTWVNSIVHGIFLGGVYALLAAGLSLMFGVMRIINLAHGSLALVGAYAAYVFVEHTGLSAYAAIPPVVLGMFVVGYLLQRTMLERSLRAGVLVPLLTTFGLLVIIGNLLERIFSPDPKSLNPGVLGTTTWQITGTLSISPFEVLELGVAVLVLGVLQLYLTRTRMGRELRATSEDPDTAELVGIDSRAVYARAAAIAVGTAALAGIFFGMRSSFDPSSGPTELIYAFEAVVIGGLGSLWGTLVGGIVLGVAQTIGAQIDPQYFDLAGHLVFLVVLLVRAAIESGAIGSTRGVTA
ncbi:MAG TPA: branched-chain amino acid ABC transporter permease [Gaiellaceae bacterium]|nr:branched-chain amino acid ABC transporter permease [Gaiellaceae bacterium]